MVEIQNVKMPFVGVVAFVLKMAKWLFSFILAKTQEIKTSLLDLSIQYLKLLTFQFCLIFWAFHMVEIHRFKLKSIL